MKPETMVKVLRQCAASENFRSIVEPQYLMEAADMIEGITKPFDRTKVLRLVDEAWYAACDIQQSSAEGVHENIANSISLLCNAVQNLCLALKEINEPEESP